MAAVAIGLELHLINLVQGLPRVRPMYTKLRSSIALCWVSRGITTTGYSLPWLLWIVQA
jgi:hypothetical protein